MTLEDEIAYVISLVKSLERLQQQQQRNQIQPTIHISEELPPANQREKEVNNEDIVIDMA